jgi:hypothetical protein
LIEIPSNNEKITSDDTDDDSALGASESIRLKRSLSSEESVRSEHRFSKDDKKLLKRSSLDETPVKFSDTDQLSKDDQQSSPNSLSIAQTNNTNDTNVDNYDQGCNTDPNTDPRQECYPDVRRASDGSCDIKSLKENKMFDEGRRFSDGTMHNAIDSGSKKCTLMQKRRSFKRQSRVCNDATATSQRYSDTSLVGPGISNAIFESTVDNEREVIDTSTDNSTRQLNVLKSFESKIQDKNDPEIKADISSPREPNCMPSSLKIDVSTDKIERFETIEEDSAPSDHSCTEAQTCCYKVCKVCKNCKHDKKCPDCCCHAEKQRYLKRMEKIVEENKKLEDMLARNRREMTEIRDMLNNVLSVRMEPGF